MGDEVWTYGSLVQEAENIAAYLIDLGLGPGDVAGVCMYRAGCTVAVMLGILCTGAAYLPLDPDDPPSRISSLADAAGARLLIVSHELSPSLTQARFRTVCASELRAKADRLDARTISPQLADSAAYLMYTSGSTGSPKGVLVSHRAVIRLAFGLDPFIDLAPMRVLHAAPLAFDASVLEVWATLLRGGCVVIASGNSSSLERLAEVIAASNIDTAWLTSGLFNLIVDTSLESLAQVRQLLVGGEALSVSHVRRYRERHPSTRLINGYGPTENTTFTCCHVVPAAVPKEAASIPIGSPVGGTRVCVLGGRLNHVPVGAAGELYAAGEGLALGYAGDPAQTAERFIPDPDSDRGGTRMYSTGDRARYRSDGVLDFLGRADRQVKIHGHRIEPGEVEQLLRLHPNMEDAAVKVITARTGHYSLVGYCVMNERAAAGADQIQAWLEQRAPRYLIPSTIVFLPSLPRTVNGKIDYRSLPEGLQTEIRGSNGEPRTGVERRLIEIWRNALRLESLGIHDNFFKSGGDSLLALQACTRAQEAGLSFTLGDLFAHQTVFELAAALERCSITRTDDEAGPVPLNASQRFFLDARPDSPDYFNISSFFEARPRLTDEQWNHIAAAVAGNHDSLRLRFTAENGSWLAETLEHLPTIPFTRVDLRGLQQEEQDRRMRDEAQRWQAKLSISEGRMFQLVLFDLGPERHERLLAIVHHLSADGPSLPILLNSLEIAMSDVLEGRKPSLPRPSCSWRRWVSTLYSLAGSPEITGDLSYWAQPGRMELYPLPRDYCGENLERTTEEIVTLLGLADTGCLAQAASRLDAGLAEAVLSGVAVAVGQWAQTPCLSLDWIAHGREPILPELDVSRTTGYFSLRVPIIIPIKRKAEVTDVLCSVTELIRSLPRRGLSYGMLRFLNDNAEVRAMLSRTPQPEISFNYLGNFDLLRPPTRLLAPLDLPTGAARGGDQRRAGLLQVFASVEDGRLQMLWRYNTAIHRRSTVQRLAERTIEELRTLAGARPQAEPPDASIAQRL
jgi:amino acid adenylation domain-containing protein/non-ribosomal peptide synthase protein (TIGR01720 family)